MKRTTWLIALALGLGLLACHAAHQLEPDPKPQASDLTADQLIAKSNAARGGEAKLQGIQIVKLTGTFSTSQAAASPVTVTIAPGRYLRRIEQKSGGPSFKAVDGEATWQVTPQARIVKPEPMHAKDASRYRHLADPQGPLVNPQAKGNKVEVIGKQTWQGSQVYKLKVTFPDGGVNYLYLDAKSFLPVRMVSTMYVPQIDRDLDFELLYQDYRDVDGVQWPFKELVNAPEARFTQTIAWEKIEVNKEPLNEAMFKEPKS